MKLNDIIQQAQAELIANISDHRISTKINSIQVDVITARDMEKNLNGDNYRKQIIIPAYYDPNQHKIFINREATNRIDDLTLYVICYHELMHAISVHVNYRLGGMNIFQSGVKFEQFLPKQYHCVNKLFNEGIVQFFTIHLNHFDENEYGYAREVRLVKMIASDLGASLLYNALVFGDYGCLQSRFEEYYGRGSFSSFTSRLDNKKYELAEKVITQHYINETSLTYNPTLSFV